MDFQALVNISYDDVFDNYDSVNIAGLINEIPSYNAIEVLCFFMAQIHVNERDLEIQLLLLKMWSSRFNSDIQEKILLFIQKHLDSQHQFIFINNPSCLLLIEQILSNYNGQRQSDLTPDQELNLFRAYLFCTKVWLDKQVLPNDEETIATEDDLLKIMLPNQLPYVELLELKDFRIQFVKAIYFFKYCQSSTEFKTLLEIFLKDRNVNSWQEYIIYILSVYTRDLSPGKIPSILSIESDFHQVRDWMETNCMDLTQFVKDDDFKNIREKPIFKMDEKQYAFLNLNFFVDKLFQGIRFDFANSLIRNKATYNGKQIKRWDDFNSIYTSVFSEKILFYQVLQYAFQKNKDYVLVDGTELESKVGEGAPDFYIRNKTKIYLIEFKDILINRNIKHSYNFEKITEELNLKFIENQEGRSKGIKQLIACIEKFLNEGTKQFDDFDFSKAIIYPVIVYNDFSLNAVGVNYFLNKKFNDLINRNRLSEKITIKNLVMIDLDSFIKFQDAFRNKQVSLNHTLNSYLEYTSKKGNIFKPLSTYNQNLHYLLKDLKYEQFSLIRNELKGIIENVYPSKMADQNA
jgi:hypothetical protein